MALQETVWLGDIPLIVLKGASRYYVESDHLNTLRRISNDANASVWTWDVITFGGSVPNDDPGSTGNHFTYNLRFPGQYYDVESGLFQNGFRDYSPKLGRYVESDPIGLAGGLNTYGYVGGDPVGLADPRGLCPWCPVIILGLEMLDLAMLPNSDGPAGKVGGTKQVCEAVDAAKSVTLSRSRFPESVAHIEDALKAGQPATLTIDRAGAAANRRASLQGKSRIPGKDRDEYPPAMMKEGGAGGSVRPISPSDNRGSGACVGAQCRGLPDGTKINIRITD